MPLTVEQLYKSTYNLYSISLIAGEAGLSKTVHWVHLLEDFKVAEFLHGGELVFTTGIAHKDNSWLLPFAQKLKANGSTGIIVNLGPYIKALPEDLCQFCDQESFPLFTIPWEVHIVDMSRDYCDRILQVKKQEENIGNAFENMILFPENTEKYYPVLERYGFDIYANFCCIGVRIDSLTEVGQRNYKYFIQKIRFNLSSLWEKTGTFTWKNTIIFVLCGNTTQACNNIVDFLLQIASENKTDYTVRAGIGACGDGILKLSENYKRILLMLRYAEKTEEKVISYDELGVKKLLMSVSDNEIIAEYEDKLLGKLKNYDKENGTYLLKTLRKYLESNGSIQQVAEEMFIHRNTVNYQIKKIKKILGFENFNLNEQLQLLLAFQAHDIL